MLRRFGKESSTGQLHQFRQSRSELPLEARRFRRLDGSPVDAEVTVAPIDLVGVPAMLVFVRDTTELKRVEEALRESETRRNLESLLQTVGAIVWEGEEDVAAQTFITNWDCAGWQHS